MLAAAARSLVTDGGGDGARAVLERTVLFYGRWLVRTRLLTATPRLPPQRRSATPHRKQLIDESLPAYPLL